MRYLLIILSLVFLSCGSPLQFIKNNNEVYTPRSNWENIKIYFEDPSVPSINIGVINWNYWQPHIRAPTLLDCVKSLKRKAWSQGGDAIIIRKANLINNRTISIVADVIRMKKLDIIPKDTLLKREKTTY